LNINLSTNKNNTSVSIILNSQDSYLELMFTDDKIKSYFNPSKEKSSLDEKIISFDDTFSYIDNFINYRKIYRTQSDLIYYSTLSTMINSMKKY